MSPVVSDARLARWRESAKSMMQAVVLALFIRTFILQAYKIPSSSMENTLVPRDHIFVAKFLYGVKVPFTNLRTISWREPRRGDIIVFQAPPRTPKGLHQAVHRPPRRGDGHRGKKGLHQ